MILDLPGLTYGVALIVAANLELQTRVSRPMSAILSLGLTQFEPLWRAVESIVARLSAFEQPTFDRRNPVHRVAGLLLIAVTFLSAWQAFFQIDESASFYFASDIGGLLQSMSGMVLIYISIAALGVGWRMRRSWRDALHRLGLKRPTIGDCFAAIAWGCLIFAGMTFASWLMTAGLSPDQFDTGMDGSLQLYELLRSSLPAAFLVAILAGTGEEILFRGALQPVFGLIVSSMVFALVHVQYGISPATLLLFFVSLGLGLVRKRYNTMAAIIAHATYNFMPFLLYRWLPA